VLTDGHGLEVDVHAIVFDDAGNGVHRTENGADWVFPAAGFAGRGDILGGQRWLPLPRGAGSLPCSRIRADREIEFKLGIENFEVTFNPSLTNPVSFHIPGIKLPVAGKVFKLEQEIPLLGLKGTAQTEVDFVIDVLPNYRQLAKALKPSNVRA
jgi:hypothetical protein